MHFKTVALMALASVAIAAPNADLAARQASSVTVNPAEASVLSVLLTALPSSLLQIAVTNQAEVGNLIASSFSAGETPGWYSGLPAGVKSYLPVLYAAQTPTSTASSSSIASSTPAPSSSSSVVTVVSTAVVGTAVGTVSATISPSGNGTVVSTVHSATLHATTLLSATTVGGESSGAGSSAGTSAAASSTQTGGASYPTAVMGAGIAGALGFLGMLAM